MSTSHRHLSASLFAILLAAAVARAATAMPSIPTEADVLRSARDHYPIVVQSLVQWESAEADQRMARGQFDGRIVSHNHRVPVGYYERQYFDFQVEKPLPLANSRVYAGYSYGYSPGFFPPQFSTLSTNRGGTPRIGASLSLLRGLMIDERRAALRHARLAAERSHAEAQLTRVQVSRDAAITYWGWISAARSLLIYENLLALAEARRTALDERFRLGDISEIVVKENLQYVAKRRAELATARLALEQTALDLSLFWRDEEGRPLVAELDVVSVPEEVREAVRAALRSRTDEVAEGARAIEDRPLAIDWIGARPDVRAVAKEQQSNQVDRELAANLALPKLDFAIDYTKNFGRQDPTNAQNVLTLFFNVEIPIERNLIRGARERAAAQRRILDSRMAFLRETARVEAEKLVEAIRLSRERMHNAEQEVRYASDLLEAETYRFQKGSSNLFFVNAREEARAAAEETYVIAQYALIAAHAQFEAAIASGEELP